MLVEITGSSQPIKYAPRSQATLVRNRIGCAKRAAAEIGFTARIGLREGLGRVIQWRSDDIEAVAARRRLARSNPNPNHDSDQPMARNIQIALPSFGEEEWRALREPLMSGWVTQGPKVAAFEKAFAARHQVEHALATTSCTTGLHLILAALGIGPGDEVIVPSFTWVATANAIVYCGATPVIADVDRISFNIDPADVARRVTPKTKAVIAVHLFGLCADMDALRAILPAVVSDHRRRGMRCRCQLQRRAGGRTRSGGGLLVPPAQVDHDRRRRDGHDQRCFVGRHHEQVAKPWSLDIRGTTSPWAPALPIAGVQPARLQLSDDRPSRGGGAGATWKAGRLHRGTATSGRVLSRAPVQRSLAQDPGVPTAGNHAWQAFVTFVDPESAPSRETKSWSGCRRPASRPGPAHMPFTCSVITESGSA